MSDALTTVLADALPAVGTVYAVGFTDGVREELTELLASSDVTFVEDAAELTAPRDVVVAGPEWEAAFDGGHASSFADRLAALDSVLRPGGTLAVVVPNRSSTASLLTASPAGHAPGDLDGGAYDADRPGSPSGLVEALRTLGHAAPAVHEVYGGESRWCVLNPEAASLARRSSTVVRAVTRALESAVGRHTHAVLPAGILVDRLASTDALHTAASSFVAVSGGLGRALYAQADDGSVQWLDGSRHDSAWVVGGPTQDIDRPTRIPTAPDAEQLLLRAVAAADTGAFREIAARLGRWVATTSALDHRVDLDWREAVADDETFELALDLTGTAGHDTAPESRDLLLARAWRSFAVRVRLLEPDMPWPQTLSDDELLRIWLSMSGVAEERVAELVLATAAHDSSASSEQADAYSQQFAVEASAERIMALESEIAALHATLRMRDGELAVRARAIRSLRGQVLSASKNRDLMAKANEDIKNSAAFRLANQFRRAALITRPKQLARSLGKAADKRIRSVRRAT